MVAERSDGGDARGSEFLIAGMPPKKLPSPKAKGWQDYLDEATQLAATYGKASLSLAGACCSARKNLVHH